MHCSRCLSCWDAPCSRQNSGSASSFVGVAFALGTALFPYVLGFVADFVEMEVSIYIAVIALLVIGILIPVGHFERRRNKWKPQLDKIFHLKEHHTNIKTEFIAGCTTFMTMSYILGCKSSLLSKQGWTKALFLQQRYWQHLLERC